MRIDRDTVGLTLKAPLATYRIQLNKNFTFESLKEILPYLSQLGISHIYASPIFQAKEGSMHGYDVTDPNVINEELGGQASFESLIQEVSALGLGWIQDIVPNHASYSLENKIVCDVWIKGAGSAYACYFDIDWNHPQPNLYGKPLAPFLTQPYKQCLKQGQIKLIHDGGFKIKYGTLLFPVNVATEQHLALSGQVQQTLESYNSNSEFLNALIAKQYYRLAHWKTALKHINYRRFFDVVDLIGVRMENPAAYEDCHRLVFDLTQKGVFSGLRVDHIDGLYEPEAYLKNLRASCPEAYLLVEKILTGEEQLPKAWPVQGTTGYDYLNVANKLFIQNTSESAFDQFYGGFVGNTKSFPEILHDAKKTVIETYFLGDVRNLARLFSETIAKLMPDRLCDRGKLIRAVVELMAYFPIYRTYLDQQKLTGEDVFKGALRLAEERNPDLTIEFSVIASLLKASLTSEEALHALKRLQQFTGAVMAKGFEDTVLYRYTRLISLNEVGSSPAQFGVSPQVFHEFNRLRQQNWPLTLNATSTHDTKRGEDVRARLNVLSEIPSELWRNIVNWAAINAPKKRNVNGNAAPNRNEEYYFYQTLLGAYPWGRAEKPAFIERVKRHMIKALREAKEHTSWVAPNPPYEDAVTAFASETLSDERFLEAFLPFQEKIAFYGVYNSLAQTLLKVTCPGIPDFYQGTELWEFNLVDPDNRRPVDFQKRQHLLTEIASLKPERAKDLLSDDSDGKAKLYVIYKALQFRRKNRMLFEEGDYIPLAVKGEFAGHVVAFCRKKANAYALVVVPRFHSGLLYIRGSSKSNFNAKPYSWETMSVDWAGTYISLPAGAPARWTDVFTDKILLPCCGRLPLRDALAGFAVALLWSESNG
jgi:(1->4)-alpha-D-glucan 1-alpha-D-glucosylmutase